MYSSPYAPIFVVTNLAARTATARRAEALAPATRGMNFFDIDSSGRRLLSMFIDEGLLSHLTPHLSALGEFSGTRLCATRRQCHWSEQAD
jgi:hypothetical protein